MKFGLEEHIKAYTTTGKFNVNSIHSFRAKDKIRTNYKKK